MKKLLLFLTLCILAVFMVAAVANAEEATCEHKCDSWIVSLGNSGFLGDIVASSQCSVCGADVTEVIPSLFITLGYSSSVDGVMQAYGINRPAVERYEQLSKETVRFGAVVALKDTIGDRNPLDSKGNPVSQYVACKDYTDSDISIINVAIKGVPDSAKDTAQMMCALYVNAGGRTTYIDNCAEKTACGAKTFDEISAGPAEDVTALEKYALINGKRYHQLTIEELELTANKYWQNKKVNTGNDTAKKFFATNKSFTKEELPSGTIIMLTDGDWQYRAEKYSNKLTATRPLTTKNSYTVVDDSWWYDSEMNIAYDRVGFNISRYPGNSPTENVGNLGFIYNSYTLSEVAEIFKIYVPVVFEEDNAGSEGGDDIGTTDTSVTPPSSGEDVGTTDSSVTPPSSGEDVGTTDSSVAPPAGGEDVGGTTPDYSDLKQDWADDGALKILAIGNSFSTDTMEYVYQVAKDAGVTNIKLGNMFIGGCSLETHLYNALNNKGAYTFYTNTEGKWSGRGGVSIKTAVESDDWDFIMFQQVSGYSGIAESYDDLVALINYVEPLNPSARLAWNMTWAYKVGSGHADFSKYNKNQMTMYNAIVNAVQTKILTNNKIEVVVPAGTAVQNVRTSFIEDTTRDGYHLSFGIGRYIASMTLVKALTGLSIDNSVTFPDGVYSYEVEAVIECVNNAINTPFAITNSTYVKKNGGPGVDDSANFGVIPEGYVQLDSLQMGLTFASFYNTSGTGAWQKITDGFARGFMATKKFTREELPVGSIIEIAVGWQYRPEGWKLAESRLDNVTTLRIVVDEAWWGSYVERGFNISQTAHTTTFYVPIEMYTADVADSIFRIYVPASVAPEATEPETPSYEYDYVEPDPEEPETPAEPETPSDPTKDLVRVEYMGWMEASYWNSTDTTNHSVRITTADNSKYFWSTRTFTKEQLPVGSVIIVEAGAQYRVNGWNTFGQGGNRTEQITTSLVIIDEAWWGTNTVKAFNVSYTTSDTSMVGLSEETVNGLFIIYVPQSAAEANKEPQIGGGDDNGGDVVVPGDGVYVSSKYCDTNVVSINGNKYRALTIEGMGLVKNAYYFSTNKGPELYESGTTGTPAKYFATKTFTKSDLPNGTVIWVNSGWMYRPEAWPYITNNRPVEITTTYTTIDDTWWGTYTTRAFNISKSSKASLVSVSAETVFENFKIYIPVENIVD